MTIRAIEPEDIDTAADWWRLRGQGVFWREALPPIGVVAEDASGPAGMCWLANWCNVGIAQAEWLIMRPGLTLAQAGAAGGALMAGVESAAKAVGYSHVLAYALPACARYLRRMGWDEVDDRPKIAMLKTL